MLHVKTRLGTSPIHGTGLFADEFIPKGTVVWSYLEGFDARLPASIMEQLTEAARQQLLRYSAYDSETDRYELCADDARFFNHSDDPNTASVPTPEGRYVDIALRDIQVAEELTCDYRAFDHDWRRKLGDPEHRTACNST
jgi:uncharacterized protein